MRFALTACLVLVCTTAPKLATAQDGRMPTAMTDHSASRVDAEVFGWSVDYREMAAVALNTHRNVLGGQRGEVLLVVWDVNRIAPINSIQTNVITAAELPHAPIALAEAKNKLDEVDYNIGTQWPMRPKKTRPNGWMTVDTLWDPIHVSATDCRPAVAFVLSNGDALRFQAHQTVSDVIAPCDRLRMSHTRTYWAKDDLAVVMAKFEWSPDEHEMSFRQPVSAKWTNASELRFVVRAADPSDPRALNVVRSLGRYGKVRVVASSAVAHSTIAASPKLAILAARFAKELDVELTQMAPEGDSDITITLGDGPPLATPTRRLSRR